MSRIEKSVFISYRKTNLPWALAIYQELTTHGYDVFFDYQSISTGDFEKIILENIKARAHFIVLLTPSALERSTAQNDWFRREIEMAIDEKRNIVPLFLEGFDFGNPSINEYLTGKIALLKAYNGLYIPADYFSEAMNRLRTRFLNVSLDINISPISKDMEEYIKKQQNSASKVAPIAERELTAQEWFEKGYLVSEESEKLYYYTQAIELNPNFAMAYFNRGNVRKAIGDLQGAIIDYTKAIQLQPDYIKAFHNRGITYKAIGNFDKALEDYNIALKQNPNDVGTKIGYAGVLKKIGKENETSEQIGEIKPLLKYANTYNKACYEAIFGNKDKAIELLRTSIKEKPRRKAQARIDSDLENIRDDPRFKKITEE